MLPRIFAGFALAAIVAAPTVFGQVELANLREDVRGLSQRLGELSLRIEQLERENAALRQSTQGMNQTYVTLAQLNNAIADLNSTIRSSVASSKNETLQHVATEMEKLAIKTNLALESVAKSTSKPPAPAAFSENFPKEGISYTVRKGDSLASIAKKFNAKQQDIINANKIADPARIVEGQPLFIPGGK